MNLKLTPLAKHDLLLASSPTILSSPDEVLETWRLNLTMKSHKIAVVYTYQEDSPKPMLSSKLDIIGYCPLHVASSLLSFSSQWHSCHLGVKRADGPYKSNLNPDALKNSSDFALFVKNQLFHPSQAAILGFDSKGRCGIITSTLQDSRNTSFTDNPHREEYSAWEYFASCSVTSLNEIQHHQTPKYEGVKLWKPPDMADDSMNLHTQVPIASMKHDFDHFPSSFTKQTTDITTYSTDSNRKRHHSQLESENVLDESFHSNNGAAAADKFYSSLTRSLDTRSSSRLFHMRNFNGWVKACQIAELTPQTGVQRKNSQLMPNPRKSLKLRVLDLACGKGGDLGKWIRHDRGVETYVGIDVARGSLKDAALRARSMRDSFNNGACTLICADLGADRLRPAPQPLATNISTQPEAEDVQESTPKLLCWSLAKESSEEKGNPHFCFHEYGGISQDESFDVVSIQFAIHYMMSTRQRAVTFFRTVSDLLDVGGNLIVTTIDARVILEYIMASGYNFHDVSNDKDDTFVINIANGTCRLKFRKDIVKKIFSNSQLHTLNPLDDHYFGLEYVFTLMEGDDHAAGVGDAVNLPEWLSPLPVLEALATEAGLALDYAVNFHEFYTSRKNPLNNAKAHSALYSMKVLNRNGTISDEEWEISRLYIALKFTKVSSTK